MAGLQQELSAFLVFLDSPSQWVNFQLILNSGVDGAGGQTTSRTE
jgi:hypothetical protein